MARVPNISGVLRSGNELAETAQEGDVVDDSNRSDQGTPSDEKILMETAPLKTKGINKRLPPNTLMGSTWMLGNLDAAV